VFLDAKAGKYTQTVTRKFAVSLGCSNATYDDPSASLCPGDGDEIHSRIAFRSTSGAVNSSSIVRTKVRASPSCRRHNVSVTGTTEFISTETESVTISTQLFDEDMLPIDYSTPRIHLMWTFKGASDQTPPKISLSRDLPKNSARNKFSAEIPSMHRSKAGNYRVRVVFPDSNNCVVHDEEVTISCPGEKVLQDDVCVSMNTSQVIFGASVS
jgi:hypothetical protein